MRSENLKKIIKSELALREMTLKDLCDKIGETSANLNNKLTRNTLKVRELETILDALELKLEIVEDTKE